MKKTVLQILILLLSLSSIAQIDGKFKHNICEFGPNCFVYKFNENGTFEYQYHQDILGSGTLTGTYKKIGDTLKLSPDKVLYAAKSKIIEKEYKNSDSTKIEIKFQRLAEKGKTDIENWDWYVSINNAEFIKTNENGVLTIPRAKVEKIEIKDILKMEIGDDFLKLTDSIFRPETDKNYIEIFASESEETGDIAILDWMTKTFVLKGRKLYPLTFEPEVGFLGQKKTYYRKFE
ncbi:hypothetical protein [Lutibacter agarilyticus]|uniref:hypothetical protein n=1 Tax=Lutibacter agarilyticus TaxID=1109740 RepID=UPI0011313B54|nr:hypothetical protein [Lutibacter agarilyticus]